MDALQRLRDYEATRQAGPLAPGRVLLAQGLPLSVNEGAGLVAYGWTGGELDHITEANGTRLDYRYGSDGRLLAVQRNGQRWADYRYDAAGRLIEVQRLDGPLQHDHDAQGRLIRTRRGDASPWTYRWSEAGGTARVSDAACELEHSHFDYDAQGRPVTITQTATGQAITLQMQFDAQGRLDQLRFAEWQQQLSFEWDERGRPLGVGWNGRPVVQLGSDDAAHCSWVEAQDGLRLQTWHERGSGRALRQRLGRGETPCWQIELERDAAFRLSREGERRYGYDALGRLVEACDGEQRWAWRYDLADLPLDALPVDALGQPHGAATPQVWSDAAGRIERVLRQAGGRDDDHSPGAELAAGEFVYRHNQAGELLELLRNGRVIARCDYDHKGRLLRLQTEGGTERYVYGSDDGLLAVADAAGQPRLILLRTPLGLVGAIDFRRRPEGEFIHLWCDHAGNLVAASRPGEAVTTLHRYDPWGLPLAPSPIGCDGGADIDLPRVDLPPINLPPIYRGRLWQAALGLYRLGGRWYDPRLRRFLTPDTHTGAPDDARLVNPFVPAGAQRMRRASVLGTWLREPRLRQRWAYCSNDPVNRFDPNGHWSAGGVLLSLLGVLWTLPNTAFGLAIEVSCLLGEVVRWLVHACSGGEVSWQTPGFDVAASGRLNAFALVFKGGWIGSFEHLLGITFGNVIFVNGNYQQHEAILALPDEVAPTAYGGSVTIPRAQALYEHELRHVNQYSWWGPFFHLGLPLFGIYEWDVILNGYQDASLEQDARAHGGL